MVPYGQLLTCTPRSEIDNSKWEWLRSESRPHRPGGCLGWPGGPNSQHMYSKASVTELQMEIASFRDTFITTAPSRDTNENWNFFTNGLMKIIHKLVPQKVTRQRHDLPWLDRQLRTKINRKNRYHRRAKKAKPAFKKQRWEAYKHQQSINIQKEIKTAYNN